MLEFQIFVSTADRLAYQECT